MRFSTRIIVLGGVCFAALPLSAQTPPDAPTPIVIGRDPRETREVIGKNFLLRVWLSNVGGVGVQQISAVRVDEAGNITMKGLPATKAEGVTIAALEQQVTAVYKAGAPTAQAWVSVIDRTPPAPPAPPPPPPPPVAPAPAPPVTPPPAPVAPAAPAPVAPAPPPVPAPAAVVAPAAAVPVAASEVSAKPQAASQPVAPAPSTAPAATSAPATNPSNGNK